MIGEKIKELRKQKNMSQEALGNYLGMSKFSISLYEHNKTLPTHETLVKMAKLFNISTDYLLELVDQPYSYLREDSSIIRIPEGLSESEKKVLNDFAAYLHVKYGKTSDLRAKRKYHKREREI